MLYNILLGTDGRVIASSADSQLTGSMAVDTPEGFTGAAQHDWRYDDGRLVYDPLPQE